MKRKLFFVALTLCTLVLMSALVLLFFPVSVIVGRVLSAVALLSLLCLLPLLPSYPINKRIADLGLRGVYRLKKSARNMATYYFDHQITESGEVISGQLQFAWGREDGEEILSRMLCEGIYVRIVEDIPEPTVEFIFKDMQSAPCGLGAKLNDDPNWWLSPKHMTETGFQRVIISITGKQLDKETYLKKVMCP